VVTTLQRRVPNIPVLIAPAPVQGSSAPAAIVAALQQLYGLAQRGRLDVILLVRGGGSLEDLWAFNDEVLARAVFQSPVPLVSGVGHETDFTIVDFVADLRAPTPTAAAELVAEPRAVWMGALELLHGRLQDGVSARLDRCHQQLDLAVSRLGRPSARLARQRLELSTRAQRLRHAVTQVHARLLRDLTTFESALPRAGSRGLEVQAQRLERVSLRLQLLDPRLVLQRGYAWLSDLHGRAVTRADQTHAGQALQATLADGKVDLTVSNGCGN
jgi:exodeoxyribonuclease VII large subunit